MYGCMRKSILISRKYSSIPASDLTRRTSQPRSPMSGLRMRGKLILFSRMADNTMLRVAGCFNKIVLGFIEDGTFERTSNFDSPIMPPERMPGLDAEKKNRDRARIESHSQ